MAAQPLPGIALVNAASTQSPPATTYTYDPAGNPTVSGTANAWPFQYQGMEKEFTDPGPYYYTGGGQFYSAQIMRSPSETGETSSQGSGGGLGGVGGAGGGGGFSPSGMAITPPSVSTGGLSGQSVLNDSQQALQVGTDIYSGASALGLALFGPEGSQALAIPLAIIGGAVDFLVNFFEDIFGGGSTPEIPRQLRHQRHPLYPVILGFPDGEIPDEVSKGKPQLCGDAEFSGTPPLQSPEYRDLSSLTPFSPNQGETCTEPPPPPCNPDVPGFVGNFGWGMTALGGVGFIAGTAASGGLGLPAGAIIYGGFLFSGTGLAIRYGAAAAIAACK